MLFYSRPPGARQKNSRGELIKSVSLGNWEWQLESSGAQALGAGWGGHGLETVYPYFQWKIGKLGFAQPPGSTVRLILRVCGAG